MYSFFLSFYLAPTDFFIPRNGALMPCFLKIHYIASPRTSQCSFNSYFSKSEFTPKFSNPYERIEYALREYPKASGISLSKNSWYCTFHSKAFAMLKFSHADTKSTYSSSSAINVILSFSLYSMRSYVRSVRIKLTPAICPATSCVESKYPFK